jgi:Abortive infection alpha
VADDAELIKAGVQGMVEGTLSPFAKIVDNLFGPASTTLGLAFNERMKRFTHRSKQMLEAKKKEGGEGNLRLTIIVPIVQYGAMEENDELQDRWAALLANTASGGNGLLPAAPDILRQLSPLDVLFLQLCYELAIAELDKCNHEANIFHVSDVNVTDVFYGDWQNLIDERYGIRSPTGKRPPSEWALTLDNCLRLGLIKEKLPGVTTPDHNRTLLMLTDLGFRFIGICQIPKGIGND